jgi:hypothetical protein
MPAEAGTNRFAWDMRYPGGREIPPPAGFVSAEYGRAQAPAAPPGRYRARLSVGGKDYEKAFEIRRDPRLTATDADLQAQFDLMVQIHKRLTEITDAVERLRKVRQQLDEGKRAGADAAAVAGVKQKLGAIEGALTRLLPAVNQMKLPPKALNNRLAALTGAVMSADARPTRQMSAVFEELSAGVAAQLQALDDVIKKDVPAPTKSGGQAAAGRR